MQNNTWVYVCKYSMGVGVNVGGLEKNGLAHFFLTNICIHKHLISQQKNIKLIVLVHIFKRIAVDSNYKYIIKHN